MTKIKDLTQDQVDNACAHIKHCYECPFYIVGKDGHGYKSSKCLGHKNNKHLRNKLIGEKEVDYGKIIGQETKI